MNVGSGGNRPDHPPLLPTLTVVEGHVDQTAIRRVAVLCVELSTAQQWLAAELAAPSGPDLAACTCRALRRVDELSPLTRRITGPGGCQWVYVDAAVSVARQLAAVLRQRDLGVDETRACVGLAVETLSLASRLGFSLARRGEICRCVAAVLASWLWRAAVVGLLLLCLMWIAG